MLHPLIPDGIPAVVIVREDAVNARVYQIFGEFPFLSDGLFRHPALDYKLGILKRYGGAGGEALQHEYIQRVERGMRRFIVKLEAAQDLALLVKYRHVREVV